MSKAKRILSSNILTQLQLNTWNNLSNQIRLTLSKQITRFLNKQGYSISELGLQVFGPENSPQTTLQWLDTATGLVFSLIPGGTFPADYDEQLAIKCHSTMNKILSTRDMAHLLSIKRANDTCEPLLMACQPLSAAIPSLYTLIDNSTPRLSDQNLHPKPMYFHWNELKKVLKHFGWSLPTSSEYQWALNGGATPKIFYWDNNPKKNNIPDYFYNKNSDAIAHKQQQFAQDYLLINPVIKNNYTWPISNNFGLIGMVAWSSWCWPNNTNSKHPPLIFRGGSAEWYPWQTGSEWIYLLSAWEAQHHFDAKNAQYPTTYGHTIRPIIRLKTTNGLKRQRALFTPNQINRIIKTNLKQAKIHYNQGVAENKQGDLAATMTAYNKSVDILEAVIFYDSAFKIPAEFATVYISRALILMNWGDYGTAIKDFNKAIQLHPHNPNSFYNRAFAHKEQGYLTEAINDYTHAISLNPQWANAYLNRGITKASKGDYNGAISDYNQAIKLNPQYAKAYNNRGNIKNMLGNIEEAISDYNKAIALNVEYTKAYFNRANVHSLINNNQEAMNDYNQAIRLNPTYAAAYDNRGVLKAKLGDIAEAMIDFNQAIHLNPHFADTYINRGIAYSNNGECNKAIADWTEAIRLNPQSLLAYSNRAAARYQLEDYTGAITDCNKALQLDTKYAFAYNIRGKVYYKLSKYTLALADYNQAIRFIPQANFYYNRGQVQAILQNYMAAIADFKQTLHLEPNHPQAEEITLKISEWLIKQT